MANLGQRPIGHRHAAQGPGRLGLCAVAVGLQLCLGGGRPSAAQRLPPLLTQPVNDFARVIDARSTGEIDGLIRSLEQTTGDVVVVATVDTVTPYVDIRAYAVKMFENGGRGIGDRARDNGVLILVAIKERRVWVEVGYGLEEFITDGFAGAVSREMAPAFAQGNYGAGLLNGTARIVGRIADSRNVTLGAVSADPRLEGTRSLPWDARVGSECSSC